MYIYRTLKRLSEPHPAKYKPFHPIPLSQKNIYFCYIRCYTCVQIFLHELLHESPSHVFINRLKVERFSTFLICGSSLFHIFDPRTLKLFPPNITWITLTTFKFRFRWLRTGLSVNLISKMFHIKQGFNWCKVLKNFKTERSQSLYCHYWFF